MGVVFLGGRNRTTRRMGMETRLTRLTRPFRRLKWKLTLSYTALTVAAILILQAAGLIALRLSPHTDLPSPEEAVEMLRGPAAEAAPYLAKQPPGSPGPPGPPDLAALRLMLRSGRSIPGGLRLRAINFRRSPGAVRVFWPIRVVMDRRAQVLASSYHQDDWDKPLSWARRNPEAFTVASTALAGATEPADLCLRAEDGSMVAAVPIVGEDGAVLGALVEIFPKPPGLGGLLLGLLSWRNALVVLAIAAFTGALFGFLTARWLTRRLRTLAAATDGWGRGDFSVLASDRSGDEIGELARRLDHTAGQVQELLADREQLAVIEERNRLARDLHDSVAQTLYAVTLYAEAAMRELLAGQAEAACGNVRELRSSAEQALREMRLLIFELRPHDLEKAGLVPALQIRLEAVEERAGLTTEFRAEGVGVLPAEIEGELYRIAQEALNNTLKHARSGRVSVCLRQEGKELVMEIADDGTGFAPDDPGNHKGLGLRGMQERAARLGGRLILRSQPGEGTTVRVVIPL